MKLYHTAIIALLTLAACEPVQATRGHIIDPDQVSQIKAGETTKQDVVRLLGTPSTMGTFDDHSWYYIGQHIETESFFDPVILDRSILALHFNDQGVVDKMQTLTKDDGKQVAMTTDVTPTGDKDRNFIEELFAGINHVTPSAITGTGTSTPGNAGSQP